MHNKSHLGLSTTSKGKLSYDVVDAGDDSWKEMLRKTFSKDYRT